ncbi:unnamed protein product [Jaminaea pallidilutea]
MDLKMKTTRMMFVRCRSGTSRQLTLFSALRLGSNRRQLVQWRVERTGHVEPTFPEANSTFFAGLQVY